MIEVAILCFKEKVLCCFVKDVVKLTLTRADEKIFLAWRAQVTPTVKGEDYRDLRIMMLATVYSSALDDLSLSARTRRLHRRFGQRGATSADLNTE